MSTRLVSTCHKFHYLILRSSGKKPLSRIEHFSDAACVNLAHRRHPMSLFHAQVCQVRMGWRCNLVAQFAHGAGNAAGGCMGLTKKTYRR